MGLDFPLTLKPLPGDQSTSPLFIREAYKAAWGGTSLAMFRSWVVYRIN